MLHQCNSVTQCFSGVVLSYNTVVSRRHVKGSQDDSTVCHLVLNFAENCQREVKVGQDLFQYKQVIGEEEMEVVFFIIEDAQQKIVNRPSENRNFFPPRQVGEKQLELVSRLFLALFSQLCRPSVLLTA